MGSHALSAAASTEVHAALDDVRRLVQALRRSAGAAQRQLGISGAQLFVLQRLAEHPGASVGELAQHTATHQSSVSVVARRLIERGLVLRAPSPTDRRRAVLRLTPRGHALLRHAPASPGESLQAALSRLPSPTRRGLALGLRALLAELGASHLAPSLLFEDEASPRSQKKVRP